VNVDILTSGNTLTNGDALANGEALAGRAHSLGAHHRSPGERVRVFESRDARADRDTLERLRDGLDDADLAAPAVVLPDFHHKSAMETPSSVAVATRETIRPTLTSSSLNCGMALISFDMERPDNRAITEFYRAVRERYPFPRNNRRELTPDDVVRCATEGGEFAVDRFDVDPDELLAVEEGGRIDLEPFGGPGRARRSLPRLIVQLARLRFGSVGPSNHFIELQQIEEVLDPVAAGKLGLAEGQVTLQYHAGGGVLTGELGRLFGRRKDYPRPMRMVMGLQKPLYHLASARSLDELKLRLQLYFRHACPPVARDSDEGTRLMLANAFAMNYGFAFRLATYATLRRLAEQAFGPTGSHLVVDSPHNSIYEEEVGGESVVVHRHNSCRAYPAAKMSGHPVFGEVGQPLLLPGTHRTASYLCVAGDQAERSLYSACHGAGTLISDFAEKGLSGPDPLGRSTLRFRYSDQAPVESPHLDNRGVDEALSILSGHGIVRPVARLRPFSVLN
jgi:tRNA-splicing ligase RtcB